MVLLAFSVQDQIEKYGAYVSIACFLGLAVLSLLYFSQARELKRLREWAGRAPERARELEQRVVAQATATVARRAPAPPAKPGAIAPPRRLAEMPAPQTAAGGQATELVDKVEQDEPATNGNVPAPPAEGEAAAAPANGTVPHEGEAAAASPNGVAAPAEGDAPPAEGDAASDAPPADDAATAAERAPGADAPAAPGEASAPAAPGEASAPAAPGGASAPAAPGGASAPAGTAGDAPADTAPAPAAASGDAAPAETASGTVAGEVPPAVPRVTPAQRVGVEPRPAPMPLRQSKPSAVATGRGAPRKPAPRRGAGRPPRERSGGTIALIVGLVVLILGGGTFLVAQLLGGDDDAPATNRVTPPSTATESPEGDGGSGGSTAQAAPRGETDVAVLNGTTQDGLASNLADKVAGEGYVRGTVQTNGDQAVQDSVVYYGDGMRPAAQQVARLLSIRQVAAIDDAARALAPDADVVVLAGADQAP